ncbi:nuclear transport factor 2 family protein [bacterium]|nr:nuclear transport factor 2 family protein [bacterium]
MTPPPGVQAFFAAMNARDAARLGELLADDAVFHFPKTAPLEGATRILRFFKVLWRGYPRLEFSIRSAIEDPAAARAAVHWTNAGQTREGEPYANEGVTLLAWADGRFTWISDFFKDTERF